jgi:DNA-binding response OmpR family regulator
MKKVLIIDDDADLREAMTAVLSGAYELREAGDKDWLPVDDYIVKPIEPKALLTKIRKLL